MKIEQTLEERGNRYGSFEHHAMIAQHLQDVMRAQAGWVELAPDQKQALTVIADKIARMLNGDPNYRDNWHDIVGYAKLVDDRMARDEDRQSCTVPICFVQGCMRAAQQHGACVEHMPSLQSGKPACDGHD